MSGFPIPPENSDSESPKPAERKGPRVILPDATAQTVVQSIETAAPLAHARRPFFGFVASLGLGLIGAAVWAGITLATDYQIGLVAIVIGLLAGVGARMGGPGRGAQWTGAICAAIAYFVGQTAIIVVLMATQPGLFDPDEGEVRTPPATTTQPAESPDSGASDAQVSDSQAERDDLPDWLPSPDEMHPLIALAIALAAAFVLGVVSTFSSMGVIFLAIAVYEGYRIPRAA